MWYELTTSGDSIFCCVPHLDEVIKFWQDQETYKKHPEKCVIIFRPLAEPEWECGEFLYQKLLNDSIPTYKMDMSNMKPYKFPKHTSFYIPKSD